MTLWSCHRLLAGAVGAAFLLLTQVSVSAAQAQSAAQAAPQPDQANPQPAASPQPSDAAQTKSLTATAIDKVRAAAKSAADIFSRVPCLPPKGGAQSLGSLPHVAKKLVDGEPVVIIAFGSSSTAGTGARAPEVTYPSRLASQLKRHYPTANIAVINAGIGGEDAPEMMKRLQTTVIDRHPDL